MPTLFPPRTEEQERAAILEAARREAVSLERELELVSEAAHAYRELIASYVANGTPLREEKLRDVQQDCRSFRAGLMDRYYAGTKVAQ